MNIDIFSIQVLLESTDCLLEFIQLKMPILKGKVKIYSIIINGKTFYDQAIDSDIKWYEEIRKLTTGKGEDYTIECLLDYDYIKIIVD